MIYKEIDFSLYSSVKIGPKLEVAVLDDDFSTDLTLVGKACNLLISPNPPKLGILSQKYDFIKLENEVLKVGAATSARKLYDFALKHDLAGFELCASVPGSLGGLIKMNAGLKGFSISDYLLNIRTNKNSLNKSECGFEYRKSAIPAYILEASFELKKGFDHALLKAFDEARKNQPKGASFGSVFKNPAGESAGRLIEAVGLKGKKIGACSFSDKHANFLINHGGGTFSDALSLINLAKSEVLAKFGIGLECEVVIL